MFLDAEVLLSFAFFQMLDARGPGLFHAPEFRS
jgi:hypothetical protein